MDLNRLFNSIEELNNEIITNRYINNIINDMINNNNYPESISYLLEKNYIEKYEEYIFNYICNDIMPYLIDINDYKNIIERLNNFGITELDRIYYNIGAYLTLTNNIGEDIEVSMNIIRKEIISKIILENNFLEIFRRVSNNNNNLILSYINYDNLEDVKLTVSINELNKIPIFKYSELLNNSDEKCSICLENFKNNDNIRKIECNHLFHLYCIDKWLLEESYKCPNCKSKIANYRANI